MKEQKKIMKSSFFIMIITFILNNSLSAREVECRIYSMDSDRMYSIDNNFLLFANDFIENQGKDSNNMLLESQVISGLSWADIYNNVSKKWTVSDKFLFIRDKDYAVYYYKSKDSVEFFFLPRNRTIFYKKGNLLQSYTTIFPNLKFELPNITAIFYLSDFFMPIIGIKRYEFQSNEIVFEYYKYNIPECYEVRRFKSLKYAKFDMIQVPFKEYDLAPIMQKKCIQKRCDLFGSTPLWCTGKGLMPLFNCN